MSDKAVRFCTKCEGQKCKLCDKNFHIYTTTSFHLLKEDITKCDTGSAKIIVDLGCPNSVIGVNDVDRFMKSLSHFQQ